MGQLIIDTKNPEPPDLAFAVKALMEGRKGRKLDQIAYYCMNPEAERMVKATFGLPEDEEAWSKDTVTARSIVYGGAPEENVAELQFCYALGIEFELIRYVSGPNWHDHNRRNQYPGTQQLAWQSHIGLHLNEEPMPNLPLPLAQETWTLNHTNSATEGRKYHYRIYDARAELGSFVKFIKRLG